MDSVELQVAFKTVLTGANHQILHLNHPSLQIFAQNSDGKAALLVRGVAPDAVFVGDAKGFEVRLDRNHKFPSLTLISNTQGISTLFLKFVEYVFAKSARATDATEALNLVTEAIHDFKDFASQRSGRLSLNEVRGLFAELTLIRRLLEKRISDEVVLNSWRGPYSSEGAGLVDFVFPNGEAIEVKSSQQPATVVHIGNPEQIRVRDKPMFLAVLPLETTPHYLSYGESILELLKDFQDTQVAKSPHLAKILHKGLELLGFDPNDDYYKQWRFVAGDWKLFEVRTGFPEVQIEHIPLGVVRLTYSLQISSLSDFESDFDYIMDSWGY